MFYEVEAVDIDEAIVHEIGNYLDFEAIDVSKVRLRCDYCGRFTKDADLSAEYTWPDQYMMCKRCKAGDSPD